MSLRKTVRFLVLAVCALATFVATSQAAAPAKGRNLLGNPGFERGFPGADWMPASWDTSDAGIPTVFFGRDTMGAHGGQWCVNIANTSTVFPMAHNWSQTLIVGKEAWNQTARFSIWTRTNGLQGRAYVLIQAYRDSASKMSRVWGVDRDEARRRLNIKRLDDPSIDLGWDRLQFNEPQTDWVKREVSVYVPYGVNVIFVRAGIFGTGQLMLDDASLTLESAPPLAAAPKGNLFADPGFEAGGLDWEWVIPPFEGARVDLDSTYAHGGRYSMRVEKMRDGLSATRSGVTQSLPARALAGKRVRLSGWFKGDSLRGTAYLEVFAHTPTGPRRSPVFEMLGNTFDWTRLQIEYDVPADAQTIWPWLYIPAPFEGTVWLDDAELEVIGPASTPPALPSSKALPRK